MDLKKAIANCPVAEGRDRTKDADQWTRKNPLAKALIPSLADAICFKNNVRGGRDARELQVAGTDVASALTKLNHDCLGRFFSDRRDASVSPTNISNFRNSGQIPKALPLALLFLVYFEKHRAKFEQLQRVNAILNAFDLFTPLVAIYSGSPVHPPTRRVPEVKDERQKRIAAENELYAGFERLLGLQTESANGFKRDFFVRGNKKAYFLVVRRATNDNTVLMGFLSLDAPSAKGNTAHTFAHFQRNPANDFRATHGLVLCLRHAYYLLGGTGTTVPADQFQPGAGRPLDLSEALKCVAIPATSHAMNKNVWSGIFLSHATALKPIVGRCLLVRTSKRTYQEIDLHNTRIVFEASSERLKEELIKHGAVIGADDLNQHVAEFLQSVDNQSPKSAPLVTIPPLG